MFDIDSQTLMIMIPILVLKKGVSSVDVYEGELLEEGLIAMR